MTLRVVIVVLALGLFFKPLYARSIVVEGSVTLPVSVNFLLMRFDFPWLKELAKGKTSIFERSLFVQPDAASDENVAYIVPIPSLAGGGRVDYIVRTTARCEVFTSTDTKLELENIVEYDCALGNDDVVRARAVCAADGGMWDASWSEYQGFCASGGRRQCDARGGVWKRAGMHSRLICEIPYSDGGKECTDDSQCIAGCLAVRVGRQIGEAVPVVGRCRETDSPFGCFQHINNGRRDRSWGCAE